MAKSIKSRVEALERATQPAEECIVNIRHIIVEPVLGPDGTHEREADGTPKTRVVGTFEKQFSCSPPTRSH